MMTSKDIKLFSNLYSGVIYDSLTFDLKYEKPFLLNSKIKKVSGKNQNYVGPAFTCKEFKDRENNKWKYKIHKGESYQILYDRIKKFLKKNINLKKNYIIFTHEMVSKVIRGILLNLEKDKIIKLKHNSNYVFVFKNDKIRKIKI